MQELLTLGGLGGLISGAFVYYKFWSGRRDVRRKEAKELVARIIGAAQHLEALAIAYQLIDGIDPSCPSKGEEIRKQFKALGIMVTEFRQVFQDKSLTSQLTRFRQKASGNLDQRLRKAALRDDPLITEIEDACRIFCNTAQIICTTRYN